MRPWQAKGDQILAIPTLVRKLPEPVRKITGSVYCREGIGELGFETRETAALRRSSMKAQRKKKPEPAEDQVKEFTRALEQGVTGG